MYISNIKIKNFRGLQLDLDNIEKKVMIFGKNDSRKSTFCMALQKILNFNYRKNSFILDDSTDCNGLPIEIEVTLNVSDIEKKNESAYKKIVQYIYSINDGKFLKLRLKALYNSKSLFYEEEFFYVINSDPIAFSTNKFLEIDEIIDVVYFNPNYNLAEEKKNFFSHCKRKQTNEEESGMLDKVSEALRNFNKEIIDDKYIKNISDVIAFGSEFSKIFEGLDFKVISNIDNKNIFKSLDIVPYLNNEYIKSIGDGKNKVLSLVLRSKSYNEGKERIFILEEPENHMYLHNQKSIMDTIDEIANNSQIFYTSHSPYIVDFMKLEQLVKFSCNNKEFKFNTFLIRKEENFSFSEIGYLFNKELAEMLFYDNVILIEGYSEKSFYDYLTIKNKEFLNCLIKNKIGILAIYGIGFKSVKKLLEHFDINVFIKTDNDIYGYKNQNSKSLVGVKRCYEILSLDAQKEFLNMFPYLKDNNFAYEKKFYDNNILEICEFFSKNRIYIQAHNEGFEKDLAQFLNIPKNEHDDFIEKLKKQKHKNLFKFLSENYKQYMANITIENKNNPLLSFLNEFND